MRENVNHQVCHLSIGHGVALTDFLGAASWTPGLAFNAGKRGDARLDPDG